MIPGFDLIDLIGDLIFQLLNLFFGSAEAALKRTVDSLVDTPYLDPVTLQFWKSPYATTWTISIALSVPIGLWRGAKGMRKARTRETVRGALFPGEIVLVGMLSPLVYFLGVALSYGLTEMSLVFAEATYAFSDLGETNGIDEWATRFVITIMAWVLSWVLRLEIIVVQYLGFLALIMVPLAIVVRGSGTLGNWFFDKVMALASMAIFGRPLMVAILVGGGLVTSWIPEEQMVNTEGLQAAIVLLTLLLSSISPLLVLFIKKRVVAKLENGGWAGAGAVAGAGAASASRSSTFGSGSAIGEGLQAGYTTLQESRLDRDVANRPEGFTPPAGGDKWRAASAGAGVAAGVVTGGTATLAWMAASAGADKVASAKEAKARAEHTPP